MNKDLIKIIAYVEAATNLAEAVERDIKLPNQNITSDTVLKLSKFAVAANKFKDLLDFIEKQKTKIQ